MRRKNAESTAHGATGRAQRAKRMAQKAFVFAMLSALCAMLYGCAGRRVPAVRDAPQSIRIKGSDTMVFLVQRWAEEFMKGHPGIAVYTEGGGSATGIRALINGTTDICATSRPWQPEEVKELVERQGSLGISILTARDALSIYLHPDNPISNLTLEEIQKIFTSRVTN
ncbi:MAG TPA: substrate-binding domain-containing protein, partial [bacterium]